MTELARYIPHARAYWYLARGWTITKLLGRHGVHRLLATRRA